jgi:hypothetical protein
MLCLGKPAKDKLITKPKVLALDPCGSSCQRVRGEQDAGAEQREREFQRKALMKLAEQPEAASDKMPERIRGLSYLRNRGLSLGP